MSHIVLTYSKTENMKMAYNQITGDEFDDIDDLIDDANKEIISLKRSIDYARDSYHLPQEVYDKFDDVYPRK